MQPEISLCIPTFNRGQHLDYLLRHLFEQTPYVNLEYEILISNNDSSDNTNEIVAKWSDKLPIKYFEQEENIGGSENLSFLFKQAVSGFLVYLADDDLIDLTELKDCLLQIQSRPSVGIVYTPWKIGKPNQSGGIQFYNHPKDILIQKGDFQTLLSTILKYHIFPEIFIVRTEIFLELQPLPKGELVFDYFSSISEYLGHCDVLFSTSVFYTSVTDHPAGFRTQIGHEQVKFMWDSYRGGLELLLGNSINLVQQDKAMSFKEEINVFIAHRLSVAIRLRFIHKDDKIETYFLACRLRGLGFEGLLPIPFQQIAMFAALEYTVQHTKGKKIAALLLLGDFENGLIQILQTEFKFIDIKVVDEIPKNQKNSIIVYRNEQLTNGMKNNSVDANGNHYFSEYILMNVKFK